MQSKMLNAEKSLFSPGRKLFFLLFIIHCSLLIACLPAYAQVIQNWAARYNGPGNNQDWAKAVTVDASGNVYVTGESRSGGTGTEDYATIKYNSAGVQQWAARFNGPGNAEDNAVSIAVDGSGNVYVTGYYAAGGSNYDIATIKYNSSGDSVWVARYNGPGNGFDAGRQITVDGSGNVYVTGDLNISGTNFDYITIKYNSSGVQQWAVRFDGPGDAGDFAESIKIDGSGNIYVTGESTGSGTDYDYATIKYNSSGDSVWVARYNGPGNGLDYSYDIAVDGSGNVYITGLSTGSGTFWDYATVKYNSSGVQQWASRYNGPVNGDDLAFGLGVDGSGNVYVTGGSMGAGGGTNFDYATVKYNSSGAEQWVQRYFGPGNGLNDYAYDLVLDGSGNVYITGYSWGGSAVFYDYTTLKYNSSGTQQWEARYNGPANSFDVAESIALDAAGNVYVTGYSTGSGTNRDYATIKYSQLVGIQTISNEIPQKFSLSQNYPNPFNPSTHLRFEIPKGRSELRFVMLKIYDILGRELTTLVNEQLKPGTYEVEWNASNYSSGVYYYKLSAYEVSEPSTGDYTGIKKMVLLK